MKKQTFFSTIAYLSLFGGTLLINSCSKSSDGGEKPTIAGTQIFYRVSTDNDDFDELWNVNIDGTDNHKINISLPSGLQIDDEDMAEVSKDGKTVVFLAYNENPRKYAIYKCNIDGSDVKPILTTGENGFALQGFIGNGTVLFWQANANYDYELYSINIDGSNKQKINIALPAQTTFGDEELAKVTDDGKSIVFLTQNLITFAPAIYKCNIDGSNVTLVSNESADASIALQDITADNTILYRKDTDGSDNNELWAININGGSKHKIGLALPNGLMLQNEEMAKATVDGSLVFSTTNNTGSEQAIYKSKLDGSGVTLVTKIASGRTIAIQTVRTIEK